VYQGDKVPERVRFRPAPPRAGIRYRRVHDERRPHGLSCARVSRATARLPVGRRCGWL